MHVCNLGWGGWDIHILGDHWLVSLAYFQATERPSLNRQGRWCLRVNTWGCLHVDMHTAAHTCNHRPRVLSMFSSDTEKICPVTLHRQPAHLALETRCMWTPTRGLWDLTYANLPSRNQGLYCDNWFFFSEDKHRIWLRSVYVLFMGLLHVSIHILFPFLPPYHAGIPASMAPVRHACISVSRDTKQNVLHMAAGWNSVCIPHLF